MWHFLITDLAPPAGTTAEELLPRLPRLEALLARGRRVGQAPSWRHQLLALAGQPWPEAQEIPVGAHLAAAAGLAATASATSGADAAQTSWAVIAPVRCVAGLDHVQLQALGAPLPPALVARFNAELGGVSGELHATPAATLWACPRAWQVTTQDPVALVGHDMGPCLPTGPDAAALRRWMTEAQMWLHAVGEPDHVNALWPWGLGSQAAAARLPSLPWAVEGEDVWVAALPRGTATPADRVTLWRLAEHAGPAGAFAAADEAWSAALGTALREHGRVGVWLAGRCHELRAADRWRFWRQWHTPRPWWQ